MNVKLELINITDCQARAATNDECVADYAEKMQAGIKFPPVVVFNDGKQIWMADGVHRYLAATSICAKTINCDLRKGTKDDALWFASGSNQTHGLRRTNKDKQSAVTIALKLKPGLSDRAIADHCGVDHVFVGKMRSKVVTVTTCPRTGQDGKKYPPPPPPLQNVPEKEEPEEPPRVHAGPPKHLDKVGRELPKHLVERWDDGMKLQEYLTTISRLRCVVKESQETENICFAEVNHTAVLAALDTAYGGLKVALPFAICPTCQGHGGKECRLCRGRGLISEFRWNRVVPKETKELILKTAVA
jgi:hypothetical protein